MLSDAYQFAAEAHAGQRQESDGSAYIEHPVTVARLLQRGGFSDEVVAAGLLHDTVEDSGVELGQLDREFGRSVADLVAAMTEPDRPSDFRARKAAHRGQIAKAGCAAAAIFAADKIANVQNLRHAVAQKGEDEVRRRLSKPLDEKLEHYRKTLELLEELALPLSLIPLLRAELASFEAERCRGRATAG
jgi:(p)ppGpp synthase/HD superfamily hydrolase